MYNTIYKYRFNHLIIRFKRVQLRRSTSMIYSFINKSFIFCLLVFCALAVKSAASTVPDPYVIENTVTKKQQRKMVLDTIPLKDRTGDFITDKSNNPFDINTTILEQKVEYDIATGKYIVYEKIGDEYYRTPTYLTFEEYMQWKSKNQERSYFKNLAGLQSRKNVSANAIDPMSKIDISKTLIDRLFGGTEVNIKPQGGVDLTLGFFTYNFQAGTAFGNNYTPWNPLDPVDLRPRLTVDGNVGTKMKLNFNYDAQSSFDFDRKINLKYDSDQFSEDDIIKKIEAGNVSLPLKGNLIQGAQSLMGVRTDLQFGHLRMSLLASQQLSKQNNIKLENGAAVQEFEITPDQYDENRHFFLSHFNRNNYEDALSNLPQVNTSFRMAQIEVWISEDRPDYQTGQTYIAAIADLAEGDINKYNRPADTRFKPANPMPSYLLGHKNQVLADNRVNGIYNELIKNDTISSLDKTSTLLRSQFGLRQNTDFEVFRGRMLNPSEYTYHPQLGFLSLNIRLRPNQVLGVAYKYFYTLKCDTVFTVGQVSGQGIETAERRTNSTEDNPSPSKVLFVKLLKSSNQQVGLPSWDLMMKNVYNLRTSQLNKEDFQFDVYYEDDFNDGSLKKYIPEKKNDPLLNVFRLDNLNKFGDPQSDGVFDYIPGLTVIERSGSVVYPVLEPFGKSLDSLLKDPAIVAKYKYQALYDTTVTIARQQLEKSKFKMVGKVKSKSTGEINLGPFVSPGGVKVNAGGIELQEGVDYEIDYSLGKLRVLNPAYLAQGTPINVNYEEQSAFASLNKTMLGARFDYDFSKKFTIGGTMLRVKERPYTQKVNIGDDPINNKIFGFDFTYNERTPWVTKLLDRLPFYSTKEESLFNITGEAAYLKPGHNKFINSQENKDDDGGVINIDDFEGSISGYTLGGFNTSAWTISSTPLDARFPENNLTDDLKIGANRAKLSWYQLDQSVYQGRQDANHPYTRQVIQTQLFNRQVQTGQNQLYTFDITYYPEERGPYNFDIPTGYPGYTKGTTVDNEGRIKLKDPQSRWGGIMRNFQNTDFEANNYQAIEFWVLNPFLGPDGKPKADNEDGEMIFQLGNISEDIVKDNLQMYENGLPYGDQQNIALRKTRLGKVPLTIPLVNGFVQEGLKEQDLGLDGLTDTEEKEQFGDFLRNYNSAVVNSDPAGDNYTFYNDDALKDKDVLTRMRDFNNPQGNTPVQSDFDNNLFYRGNRYPESEDLNGNRSLDQGEGFYEYKIRFANKNGELDTLNSPFYKQYKEATPGEKWYRFVVPLSEFTGKNNISGFRAIQFMRMYFTEFEAQRTFRFAEFQLVRNQWRKSDVVRCKDGEPKLSVDEVGVEENSVRQPFRYVTPPGVQQEQISGSLGANLRQDEKSLAINFCDIQQGCEVAINKLSNVNLNLFKKLQMYVHAESNNPDSIKHGDLSIYIKLGKDLNTNYYEYVMPIQVSKNGDQTLRNIWPDTNRISILFDRFRDVKKAKIQNGATEIEDEENPGAKFVIKGLPSLGNVKIVEIGIRNTAPANKNLCGQIWVNELRALGMNEDAAYAVQTKAQLKLADLGDINFAGSYSSIGFGGLEQRLMERSRDEILQYDASTSLQLGKLLPKFLPINLPFFAQYTKSKKRPQYDPYQQDLETRELVDVSKPEEEKGIIDRAQETTTIKSFNFTNVRKDGGNGTKPWSLENITGSYSYSQTTLVDPVIQSDITTEKKTSIDYGYANRPKYMQPLKFIKPKALKFLSEFNFNPIPSALGFNTNLDRYVNNKTFRLPESPVFRFDDQRYKWDRNYTLDWDFTKSLRMNFRSNVSSVVDELRQVGIADDPADRPWVDENRSIVPGATLETANRYRQENFKKLGRAKNYNHSLNMTYRLPINLLPLMDWVTSTAEYKSTYTWTAGALIKIDELGNGPGNIIQNTQSRAINATFAFDKLYSKWSYLKSIESGKAAPKSAKKSNDKDAQKDKGSDAKQNMNGADAANTAERKTKSTSNGPSVMERVLIRPLMAIRNVRLSYKEDLGTSIPGFEPEASLLGLSDGFTSPGLGFAAGFQPNIDKANANNFLRSNTNWFNTSPNFNDQISQNTRQNINARIALEPFRDFKLDFDFNKDYRNTHTEIYKSKNDAFMQIARIDGGSFETTWASFNTIFDKSEQIFAQFKANRYSVSNLLNNNTSAQHPDYNGYAYGYGPASFSVVVPSFLAAYQGKPVTTKNLDIRNDIKAVNFIPKPNWTLRYDGLSKVGFFKDLLSSFSLRHGYKSTVSVANFNTQAEFEDSNPYKTNDKGNYFSQIEIPAVVMKEEFSPLLGIDMKTKNNMDIKFEYKIGRTLDLRANTSELGEQLTKSIVLGYGYIINNFKGFGEGKKARKKKDDFAKPGEEEIEEGAKDGNTNAKDRRNRKKKNDDSPVKNSTGKTLTINCDFSLRDEVSQIYKFDAPDGKEGPNPNRGNKAIQFNPSVQYQMYKNLALRLYFDYQRTDPKGRALTYASTNMSSGIVVKYTFK
jgi:cell surface protein SprA